MKKILAGLVVVAGMVQGQTVQDINSISAYSNEINAGSARYIGMGGAMGALGGDISSVEQNPAGLAVAIASDVNVTLGINSYKNETKFGNTFESDDNSAMFQNVGGTFVFHNPNSAWNRFAIGIKYSQQSLDNWIRMGRNDNITATYMTNEDPEEYTTYVMDGYHDEVVGYKTKMSLDFGASYNDRIYMGLGFNFHDTRYDNYVVFDEETIGEAGNSNVYRYDLNGTPYASTAQGFSLSAGVIGKLNDNVRLGLAYHSPVWYRNIEETYYADLPFGETYHYDLYYSQYDRNANGRLVASAGAVFAKSLALNVDYTLHMNGSTKLMPSGDFAGTNTFFDDYLKSSSEIRAGLEYRLNNFRFRGGYNFVQSPYDEITLDADLGNGNMVTQNFDKAFRGDTNRFSIGAGYDFGGFYLDAAYQFQNQKYDYVFGNGEYVDYDNGDVYLAALPLNAGHNYVAEVKNNTGMFLLTAGWQF
ncbi:OmpP1/FadL family transporter [Moheibacter sp.]|uniref:OmpP1/FadL family transporter n=1 Tax=Moheibacter sp. TaxID=1965316 RepID=UPI003C795D11